jgi:dolichol-phosphate mannosyltransferase
MLKIALQTGDMYARVQSRKERKHITKDDVTVVLPVLNEEQGVATVIDRVLENGYRNILVVDGYSTDRTVQVAEAKGVVVVQQHGRGKGGAIRTAIEHVSTRFILVMDADCTYDAADIERLLDHATEYDQIVGSRPLKSTGRLHRLGNGLICMLFNTLMGTSVSDVCSGMYLISSKSARNLLLRSNGFSVEVEILAQMAMHGNVTEVPISYGQRVGTAKLSTWVHGFEIAKSIFGLARLYNPVSLFSAAAVSAAVPGSAIIIYVLWFWFQRGTFHNGLALIGALLMLLSMQAFTVGTIAVILKRAELRIERLVQAQE